MSGIYFKRPEGTDPEAFEEVERTAREAFDATKRHANSLYRPGISVGELFREVCRDFPEVEAFAARHAGLEVRVESTDPSVDPEEFRVGQFTALLRGAVEAVVEEHHLENQP